jgi:uncharacterized protein DUF4013
MSSTPPPLLPAREPRSTIDFGRCFTFVTEDPDWIKKVLIGGAFVLASSLLIGIPFVIGYTSRVFKRVAAGEARPLPEWDDLGGFFGEGLRLFGMGLVYSLGVFGLILVLACPVGLTLSATGMLSRSDDAFGRSLGALSGVAGVILYLVVMAVFIVASVLVYVVLPAAAARVAWHGRFGAGFEWREILGFIRANLVNYLISLVLYLVAAFLAQFGVILCCVGVFPAAFWAYLTLAYGIGETVRMNPTSI